MTEAPPERAPIGRGEIARTILLALGGSTVVVGLLVVALSAGGLGEIAQGVLLGHLLAHGVTATWLLGALITFHLSWRALMVGTVGAFPIRVLLLGGAIALLVTQFHVHLAAMTLSLLASMVYGLFVEGWTFNALGKLNEFEAREAASGSDPSPEPVAGESPSDGPC